MSSSVKLLHRFITRWEKNCSRVFFFFSYAEIIWSAGGIFGFPQLVYSPRYSRGGRRGRRLPSPPRHADIVSCLANGCVRPWPRNKWSQLVHAVVHELPPRTFQLQAAAFACNQGSETWTRRLIRSSGSSWTVCRMVCSTAPSSVVVFLEKTLRQCRHRRWW